MVLLTGVPHCVACVASLLDEVLLRRSLMIARDLRYDRENCESDCPRVECDVPG